MSDKELFELLQVLVQAMIRAAYAGIVWNTEESDALLKAENFVDNH